ncbi:hypothetical protein C942_04058 [Photobacterium marinum]|uniref:Uncharacterized protein n=1 Tax=Photobacterium marinum TaxID=1056511 RepID=L8J6S3_9GAMM|nr:hypothetical protein C942_04058 [Photobacterium marinum]
MAKRRLLHQLLPLAPAMNPRIYSTLQCNERIVGFSAY